MSDKLIRRGASLPALVPAVTPRPSLPALPSSSGAIFGTSKMLLRKDTEFVQQSAAYLQARTAQSDAMTGLVESRLKLATTIAKLSALPEMAIYEYELGRRERAHELTMRDLAQQTERTTAEAVLLQTQQVLASLTPPATPPQSQQSATSLSVADVEKVAQNMPELKPETIQSLLWALNGLLGEKKG